MVHQFDFTNTCRHDQADDELRDRVNNLIERVNDQENEIRMLEHKVRDAQHDEVRKRSHWIE